MNHFPKSGGITRKDELARNLHRCRGVYGSIYDFIPTSFIVPNEYTKFVHEFSAIEGPSIWICKPADLSRGRKIFVFDQLHKLSYDQKCVVQKYVDRPLLLKGYKFDIRLYALVTSFHPLRIFLYQEGLVRFATEKYDTESEGLSNQFAHLTNYSINKNSQTKDVVKEGIGAGCKWKWTQLVQNELLPTYGERAISLLQDRIEHAVLLTCLAVASDIPKQSCCFELFGFDVIVDQQLKPWVLEVNTSPALSTDSAIDKEVKEPLIADMVDVLGFGYPVGEGGLQGATEELVAEVSGSETSLFGYVAPMGTSAARRLKSLIEEGSGSNSGSGNGSAIRHANGNSNVNPPALSRTDSVSSVESAPKSGNPSSMGAPSTTGEGMDNSPPRFKLPPSRLGNYRMIFPFNRTVERLTELMIFQKGDMRAIVNQVKKREREKERELALAGKKQLPPPPPPQQPEDLPMGQDDVQDVASGDESLRCGTPSVVV